MSIKSALLKAYFSRREVSIDYFRRHPIEVQEQMLRYLLRRGADTEFGERYNLRNIRTAEQFSDRVETFDYETYRPFRERMLEGQRNVTTRGRVTLYAKSSGTTSDRSKYIPVTRESLWHHHTLGMRDVATLFSAAHPHSKALEGKTLTLGGTCHREGANLVGDLSAVLIHETPAWSGWFRAPRMQTAILDNFDQKCERICRECVDERISVFAGVPSWNLMLMRRVLEYTGKANLLEVWPHLELFAHGGVEFAPYRASFERLLPST
ncbi:MAG: GH3 auxin-responsive promoter family protein, partial [Alistipes sp.]